MFSKLFFHPIKKHQTSSKNPPLWRYLGGISGALVVVLGAITVNSQLGLPGSIALMLLGQVLFGIISDFFGLFGFQKRKINIKDFIVVLCVITGSSIIIFGCFD